MPLWSCLLYKLICSFFPSFFFLSLSLFLSYRITNLLITKLHFFMPTIHYLKADGENSTSGKSNLVQAIVIEGFILVIKIHVIQSPTTYSPK
jgi:hypothetical protein